MIQELASRRQCLGNHRIIAALVGEDQHQARVQRVTFGPAQPVMGSVAQIGLKSRILFSWAESSHAPGLGAFQGLEAV